MFKILFGNKLLNLLIVLVSAVVATGGIYFGVRRFQDNGSQEPQDFEVDFRETGNIVSGCILIYEKPGNPALSVKLAFREYSEGDLEGNLYCGQQVSIEGQILEREDELPTKVKVLKLTKTGETDETQVCCIPSEEILPDPDPEYEGFVTYRNDKYKYEIRWRQEWKKQSENEPPYPAPPAGMTFSRNFSNDPPEFCGYSILVFDGANSFDGEMEVLKNDDKYRRIGKTIANIKGVAFIVNNDYQHVENYYFSHNDAAYRMGYNFIKTDRTERECLPVFEKMVDSFKFLD